MMLWSQFIFPCICSRRHRDDISETVLGVVQDLGRKLGLVLAEHLRDVDLAPSKREVLFLHCCWEGMVFQLVM